MPINAGDVAASKKSSSSDADASSSSDDKDKDGAGAVDEEALKALSMMKTGGAGGVIASADSGALQLVGQPQPPKESFSPLSLVQRKKGRGRGTRNYKRDEYMFSEHKRIRKQETGLHQYYIKVTGVGSGGKEDVGVGNTLAYKYSFTERFRKFVLTDPAVASVGGGSAQVTSPGKKPNTGGDSASNEKDEKNENKNGGGGGGGLVLPGIFFMYDLTPFRVQVQVTSPPFFHLLTRLVSIGGGVMVVVSMLDGFIHSMFPSLASSKP